MDPLSYTEYIQQEFYLIVLVHGAGIVPTTGAGGWSTHTVVKGCLLSNLRKQEAGKLGWMGGILGSMKEN